MRAVGYALGKALQVCGSGAVFFQCRTQGPFLGLQTQADGPSSDLDHKQKMENNPKSDQHLFSMAGDSSKAVKGPKKFWFLGRK